MWCVPAYFAWNRFGRAIRHRLPLQPFDDKTEAFGGATAMFRREVFKKCEFDSNYYIGWSDIDFTHQVFLAGWKLGILTLDGFIAENRQNRQKYPEYTKVRYDRAMQSKYKPYFEKKWGFQIL
jgi:GT2 family glycosyltransferase